MTQADADVRAPVSYADVRGKGTVEYRLADWSGFDRRRVEVSIRDARSLPAAPSLDNHGFARIAFTPAADIDRAELERLWPAMVRERLKALTGAVGVVTWAFNARFSDRAAAASSPVAAPARTVHADFSPADFAGALENPAAKDALLQAGLPDRPRRWRCFNVWQPLSAAPHDTPLALCDARSVAAGDIVPARGQLYDETGAHLFGVNLCLVRPNPNHRWLYFPDLRTDEALVFCGFDPDVAAPWGIVPHTAFDDPSCPAGAQPRSSVEIRALAVYDT